MEKGTDEKMPYGVLNADCLEAMKKLPDNFLDSIVTDPPYGISFMGKDFDNPKMMGTTPVLHGGLGRYAPGEKRPEYAKCDMVKFQEYMTPIFKEALRIAKPGAHLLAFGGTRTYHRLACAIEDAGWEVRDSLMWCYGSGFPKSMDIQKAIEKKTGNMEEAKKWNGWGTCLKPAYEPIILARKPVEGTVADNVLKYGVGGLNIDECRVPFESEADKANAKPQGKATSKVGALAGGVENDNERTEFTPKEVSGRFPANIIHDGSYEVLAAFPDNVKGGTWNTTKGARHFNNNGKATEFENHGSDKSVGSAARFFYCAKASKKEKGTDNIHPTVKPIALMEYLVKLITPVGGIVLDPFMGSGTTGIAALNLGCQFIGIEKELDYFNIAKKRLEEAFLKSQNVV